MARTERLRITLIVSTDDQHTEVTRRLYDDTRWNHDDATLLAQVINTMASTRNSRDLDRIAEAVSREHSAIFAEDRKRG